MSDELAAGPVLLDTNVFVAAGFNPESASAGIVNRIRSGRLRMIWNEATRRETQRILEKIPPLSWSRAAELFRQEDRFDGATYPEKFHYIPDAEDREFAALADAAGAILITNDEHLLGSRERPGPRIVTPGEYRARFGE